MNARTRAVGLWVAATLMAACVSEASGPFADTTTGIAVEVRRGPIMPVEQEGVDNTAPVEGATVAVLTASGRLAAQLTTDSLGRARVPVPPGEYRVGLATCPGAMHAPPPIGVIVIADSVSVVRPVCDTGIR